MPLIRTWAGQAALRGDHEVSRIRVKRLGDQLFAHRRSIGIRCVDEINSEFDRAPQHAHCFAAVLRGSPNARSGQTHRAIAEAGNVEVAADCYAASRRSAQSQLFFCLERHFTRHPPDDGLVEAEIAAFDRFWQCQFLGAGLSCTQASDIGSPSAENVDFVLPSRRTSPLVFDRPQTNQALHVDTAAGGGRSSAISRRMSANRFRGMATLPSGMRRSGHG